MAGARDGVNKLSEIIEESGNIPAHIFIIKFIFDCAFALIMPILRRNFGERFFSLPMIFIMGGGIAFTSNFVGLDNIQFYGYIAIIGGLSLFHWLIILMRNKRGEQWHTRYEGDYLPFFKFLPKAKNEWVIEGFYEPFLVVLCAFAFAAYDMQSLANFLFITGGLMLLRAKINYSIYKEKLLDDRDAMIEAQYTMDAINGVPSKDSKGFVIKGAKSLDTNDRISIGRRRLSEEVFNQNFPDVPNITMSRDEMREAT